MVLHMDCLEFVGYEVNHRLLVACARIFILQVGPGSTPWLLDSFLHSDCFWDQMKRRGYWELRGSG